MAHYSARSSTCEKKLNKAKCFKAEANFATCADTESFGRGSPILTFFRRWEDPNTHLKRAIIVPPAKRHLNGVSLAGRWWQTLNASFVALWFSRGSGPILLINPICCDFSGGGGGGPDPPVSPSLDPYMRQICMRAWGHSLPLNCLPVNVVCSLLLHKVVWQYKIQIICTCKIFWETTTTKISRRQNLSSMKRDQYLSIKWNLGPEVLTSSSLEIIAGQNTQVWPCSSINSLKCCIYTQG